MDRYAIFADAGYFFAAGAQAIQGGGRQTPRKLITLKSPEKLISALCEITSTQVGAVPLLRAYWYDAMPGPRPSLEQSTLAMLPQVKLRLGVLNNVGEQKGVDSLIVTDLIELARNRAISDAVIISGDEDLRIAVQVAQSFGVRVHILAIGDPNGNVSVSLQMEADSIGSVSTPWLAEQLQIGSRVTTPAAPPAAIQDQAAVTEVPVVVSVEEAAKQVSEDLLEAAARPQIEALKKHFTTSNTVPPDFDGRLIAKTAGKLGGRKLVNDEPRRVRGIFVRAVRGIED